MFFGAFKIVYQDLRGWYVLLLLQRHTLSPDSDHTLRSPGVGGLAFSGVMVGKSCAFP